jgi:hypothetical protein
MVKLKEVFGIATDVPKYTYVDRAQLDNKFNYFVNSDRHLVIHGASKQGKTILRKKHLPDNQCIVVPCRPHLNLEEIYLEILRKLNVKIPTQINDNLTLALQNKGKAQGEFKLPLFISGSGELEAIGRLEKTLGTVNTPLGISPNSLGFVAEQIKNAKKKIVIEDFHYLADEEKKRFAFDLKALWDYAVFCIIIGIWAEQNLLTYYNGDLSGRINEIDIQWTHEELQEVLEKGEEVLNIELESKIRQEILNDANQNVGLLQRIAEAYCFTTDTIEKQKSRKFLRDYEALNRCRKAICDEESMRYREFDESVCRGFRGSESSELKVYQRIVRICIKASDAELCNGLHRDEILIRINESDPQVRLSDLSAALNRLDKLQADRSISPLILSYNRDSRKIQLVDRELLFYRKYGNPSWSWQEVDNG